MLIIAQRCMKMLEQICREKGLVTVKQISEELNVSERTVRYDISTLRDWLAEKGVRLLSTPKKGISIDDRDMAMALIGEFYQDNNSCDIILNSDERVRMIVISILEGNENETIDDASESNGVSRTTFVRDMEKAAEWFAKHKAKLQRRQKRGVHLDANELQRRRLIVDFIVENSNENSFLNYFFLHEKCDCGVLHQQSGFAYVNRVFGSVDFQKLIDLVNETLDKLHMTVEDSAFIWLIYYLAVMATRMRNGKFIDALPQNYGQFAATDECRQIKEGLKKQMGSAIPEQYLQNEAVFITAKTFVSAKDDIIRIRRVNSEVADKIYNYIIDEICHRKGIDIYNDMELADGLKTHLQASIVRAQLDMPSRNVMLSEIKTKFTDLYATCSEISANLDRLFGLSFDENEVGFITLYIEAAVERIRETLLAPISVKALLVCGYGVGTVTFLMRSLEKQFPNIIVMDRLSVFEILKYDFTKVDVVLSTIDIPRPLPKPLIKVKPIITKLDVRRIDSFLRTANTTAVKATRDFKVNELLGIISETCVVKDSKKLILELDRLMSSYNNPIPSITNLPSLPEVLLKKYMVANIEASDWEDAVKKAAQPLLASNCITEEYVDGIIDIKNTYNQYSVVSNGVCMPHAMASAFSKLAMSLVTLKNPIEIILDGQTIKIRVFMVFSLVDTITHAKAMDEIFTMLDEFPDFIDDLCHAAYTAELSRVFRMYYDKLF
jgi:mannitol operon transcriptional antiterminator